MTGNAIDAKLARHSPTSFSSVDDPDPASELFVAVSIARRSMEARMIPLRSLHVVLLAVCAWLLPASLHAARSNADLPVRSAPVVASAPVAPMPAAQPELANTNTRGHAAPASPRPAEVVESKHSGGLASFLGSRAIGGSTTASGPPLVSPPYILYAVAADDDPAYRVAIAAITGGAVDYFDARVATPTAIQLAPYTCVYTWVNNPYADPVLMGNRLADYVDAGGKVILGVFCTFTDGFSLGGRIMTAAYSPVTSPDGTGHFSASTYDADGTKSLHAGVLAYGANYRDVLVLQGSGIANGHYADGEIAQAYRPDGRVIYTNGNGTSILAGNTGDWAKIIANAAWAHPASPGLLAAPSSVDEATNRLNISQFTTGVVDYFDARVATPSAALLATYDCVATWVNNSYSDKNLMGDRLADRVDAGGRVVLGVAVDFFNPNLGGRIMTPDYNPVQAPLNADHFADGSYAADGTTGLFTGVASLNIAFRDFVIGQGNGIVDGHYTDGEVMAAYRPDGRVIFLNGTGDGAYAPTGDWARLFANAVTAVFPTGHRLLYAPSAGDEPAFRDQIAAQTGGVVDYFDAQTGTPSAALLATYDCVYTWIGNPPADSVLFGNRLADYVDAGGKVILGTFCTYTGGAYLGGRIMRPGYSPVVSPLGLNHYASSTYAEDGFTCMHRNIVEYETIYRDILVLQGAGIQDGTFDDGEIALAYRPDRRVIYVNTLGGFFGTGDAARLIANACDCRITSGILYGCNDAAQMFVLNRDTGASSFAYNLPTSGSIGATEITCVGTSGDAWVQGRDFTAGIQKFNAGTGLPLGGVVADFVSFNGLEFAVFGKLYGTTSTSGCGNSDLAVLDPVTGISSIVGSTDQRQITGLAFDRRANALYGVTNYCPIGRLVRFDITGGVATEVDSTVATLASLEFGPDGDLYAGGDVLDGGYLYRVNTLNGKVKVVGYPGYGAITGLMLAPPGTVDAQDPPTRLAFSTPFPNPSARGALSFRFSLPTAGDARLELYDVAGRLRWRKAMPGAGAGDHVVSWDGRASSGERLGAGVYQMRLVSPAGSRAVRVVRLD